MTKRGRPVARVVPVAPGQGLLDRLVSEGRALAPTVSGPPPMPPVIGDPTIDAAAAMARARDEERRSPAPAPPGDLPPPLRGEGRGGG